MKILHTSDWHIGKIVNDFSLLEDQDYIINQLLNIIKVEKPDCILIAGDVYDRSIPPKEAISLLNQTLVKMVEEYKIPTMIITGNHDGGERLSFINQLVEDKSLYIQGTIDEIKRVRLKDEWGVVNFYLIPYVHYLQVKQIYQDERITDNNEAMKVILDKLQINKDERNVLITHHYIMSQSEENLLSDSERSLSLGGVDYIDVELVKDFDYVALGHLHKPQKIKYDHVRYSGSILKYSFSEVNYKKGVILIELKEKSILTKRFIELTPLRDLKIIEGELNTLLSKSFSNQIKNDDYLCAQLTDITMPYNSAERLRAVYPNLMQVVHSFKKDNEQKRSGASSEHLEKSKQELFASFYKEMNGCTLNEDKQKVLIQVIKEIKGDEE